MREDGQQETGRTARDRTDSKGQDRQQGTGQGLKGRLSKMNMRQDGQQETGRTERDRTDSKGQDRQQGTGQGLKGRLSKMPSRTTL